MAKRNIHSDELAVETTDNELYRRNPDGTYTKVTYDGGALITDGLQGIARTRWIDVVAATLPTVAGSGTITFSNPVFGCRVTSMMVSAGTLPLTAINSVMRVAIDAANDAAAAILLPTTFPSGDPTADAGQITSFNIPLVYVPDTEAAGDLRVAQLDFPTAGIDIPVTRDGITRLDFGHNMTGITFILGITALEAV